MIGLGSVSAISGAAPTAVNAFSSLASGVSGLFGGGGDVAGQRVDADGVKIKDYVAAQRRGDAPTSGSVQVYVDLNDGLGGSSGRRRWKQWLADLGASTDTISGRKIWSFTFPARHLSKLVRSEFTPSSNDSKVTDHWGVEEQQPQATASPTSTSSPTSAPSSNSQTSGGPGGNISFGNGRLGGTVHIPGVGTVSVGPGDHTESDPTGQGPGGQEAFYENPTFLAGASVAAGLALYFIKR